MYVFSVFVCVYRYSYIDILLTNIYRYRQNSSFKEQKYTAAGFQKGQELEVVLAVVVCMFK